MKDDVAYWDEVAESAANLGTSRVSFHPEKVHAVLHFLLKYPIDSGPKVLEIGVGRALIPGVLRQICVRFDYIGIDLSLKFCQWAKKMFVLPTMQARANELPFKTNQFDYVFLMDVLEHIDPDKRKAVYSEISRVLNDDIAYVFINNPTYLTKHPKFDWGFSQKDIGEFAYSIGAIISEIHGYEVSGQYSQFIVMMR